MRAPAIESRACRWSGRCRRRRTPRLPAGVSGCRRARPRSAPGKDRRRVRPRRSEGVEAVVGAPPGSVEREVGLRFEQLRGRVLVDERAYLLIIRRPAREAAKDDSYIRRAVPVLESLQRFVRGGVELVRVRRPNRLAAVERVDERDPVSPVGVADQDRVDRPVALFVVDHRAGVAVFLRADRGEPGKLAQIRAALR